MKKKLSVLLIFLIFLFVYADQQKDVVVKVDDGHINWTEKTVTVTGSGVPDLNINNGNSARLFCEKVALKNARYRLIKILGKMSLDGKVTVSKFISERKDMTFEVPGSRSEPIEKVDQRSYSDGAVDLKLKYSVKDALHEVCSRYRAELQKKSVSTKIVRNLPVDENVLFPVLVIEVKKKKFIPVLFPRVVDNGGTLIYGLEKLTAKDCGDPLRYVNEYKKETGLYIKAEKINKNNEIVISQIDELIVKTQLKKNVLENGKVLIVLK